MKGSWRAAQKNILKKGQIFSYSERLWERIGILEEGILCGWYIDQNAEKKISHFYFSPENYFVADYECFILNVKARHTIEAIDTCTLLEYDRQTIMELQETYPKYITAERNDTYRKYLHSQKIVAMFQNCNTVERIRLVQREAPEIMAKVPYSYIASFLGMHRNTFAEAMKRL